MEYFFKGTAIKNQEPFIFVCSDPLDIRNNLFLLLKPVKSTSSWRIVMMMKPFTSGIKKSTFPSSPQSSSPLQIWRLFTTNIAAMLLLLLFQSILISTNPVQAQEEAREGGEVRTSQENGESMKTRGKLSSKFSFESVYTICRVTSGKTKPRVVC